MQQRPYGYPDRESRLQTCPAPREAIERGVWATAFHRNPHAARLDLAAHPTVGAGVALL